MGCGATCETIEPQASDVEALDRGRDLYEQGRELADEAGSVLDRGRERGKESSPE